MSILIFMKKPAQPVPEIQFAPKKIIIGLCIQTSLSENKTGELWSAFGPRRKEIKNRIDEGSYSLQLYGKHFLKIPFLPTTVFEKWAGVAVSSKSDIPIGMTVLEIAEGRWAVFIYKGSVSDFGKFSRYIYEDWLPSSGCRLRVAPHYEFMEKDYLGPNHPEAEEKVWIPIE